MLRVNQIKMNTDHTAEQLRKKAAALLRIPKEDVLDMKIVRRSIDARSKPEIFYSYCLDVKVRGEEKVLHRFQGRQAKVHRQEPVGYSFPETGGKRRECPVVIVGMGPAGLFCGYFLALHGHRVILLERGKCVEERRKDVEAFWETGRLDEASNVQFGEGGAGAFSDGKLNTLVKDAEGRNGAILEALVKFGAKDSILYEAKPHLGTDVLQRVVRNMRNEIVRLGGEVRFQSCVTDIDVRQGKIAGVVINGEERLACEQLVLAIGHSARDTFSMLYEREVPMEAKAFAVGLRVEHPQSMVNESQYGAADPGSLGAASYKVAAKSRNGRGVYSFCMCPGGYVVNASSELGRTVVNGMSYSGRGGANANSAVIVSVTPEDFGSAHPLAGMEFQRRLEEKAYELGQGRIPAQRYGEFRERVLAQAGSDPGNAAEGISGGLRVSDRGSALECAADGVPDALEGSGNAGCGGNCVSERPVEPQCKGGYVWADLSGLLPGELSEAFLDGMESFGRQIKGFNRPDTVLLGVESRTSSPVRIARDETMQSAVRGLYPCGEGAGYAGGIASAAMDGLRVAERIAEQ